MLSESEMAVSMLGNFGRPIVFGNASAKQSLQQRDWYLLDYIGVVCT